MGIYGDIWGYINHLIFMDITMKNVNIYIYTYYVVKKWGIEWGYYRIYVLITWECSWGDLYGVICMGISIVITSVIWDILGCNP